MNSVTFSNYTFSDADGTLLQGAKTSTYFSPLGDELRAHEVKIPVIFRPADYSEEPLDFAANAQKGARISILQDGGLLYLFFLTSITGIKKIEAGKYYAEINGTDFFGLFANRVSYGGVYPPEDSWTIGTLIQDLIGSATSPATDFERNVHVIYPDNAPSFAIDDAIYNQSISGALPYTKDVRENLRYIMQIVGAYCSQITLGVLFGGVTMPYITNRYSGTPIVIPDTEIYTGDAYIQEDAPTEVSVLEYSYLKAGADVETLYEAVGASSELVVFDVPCYDLNGGGLTIDESGANYAIVSGTGTLTGRPYTVTTRRLSQSTGITGATYTLTLDNPLVGTLNSAAMLQRMVNYYQNAKVIKNAIVAPEGLMAGDLLRMNDPAQELKQGYPRTLALTFSGIDKADEELVVDWQPITGDVFTERYLFDESGTLTVPAGATLMRLILIQGGKGGWGGYKGENAHSSGFGQPPTVDGEGGNAGEGGDAGKVTIVDVEQGDLAASYTITVGTAGTGGAIDHGEGTTGTHSTAVGGGNTYSSSTGTIPDYGIADPMTGERYAVTGLTGVYKGRKGAGEPLTDAETGVSGNTTWYAGYNSSAGHGGGAAYGNDGDGAGRADGHGGDGADAVLDGFNDYTAPIPNYGGGGIGGNGGGGGGGHINNAGSGGHGSKGGDAAGGAVIALFAFGDEPTPIPTVENLLDSNGEQLFDVLYEKLLAKEP